MPDQLQHAHGHLAAQAPCSFLCPRGMDHPLQVPRRHAALPRAVGALALACAAIAPAPGLANGAAPPPLVAGLHAWIVHTHDHQGLPFALIDKRQAHLWIYDRQGALVEHAPVLLGSAVGDRSVPGIGERPLAQILPHERTTPAGRFFLEAGHNATGENVFWLDYDAAVSLHRVRPGGRNDRRLQRLSTATPADNRISYGCVNVPIAIYNRSIHALFGAHGGYAYVLPEVQSVQQTFPFLTPLVRQRPIRQPPDRPLLVPSAQAGLRAPSGMQPLQRWGRAWMAQRP